MYISTIKNTNFDNLQKELNSNRLVFVTFPTSRLTVFPITLILFRICCRNQVGGNKLVNDHLIFSEKWPKNIANLLLSFWFISKHRFVKSPQKTWFGIFFHGTSEKKKCDFIISKSDIFTLITKRSKAKSLLELWWKRELDVVRTLWFRAVCNFFLYYAPTYNIICSTDAYWQKQV